MKGRKTLVFQFFIQAKVGSCGFEMKIQPEGVFKNIGWLYKLCICEFSFIHIKSDNHVNYLTIPKWRNPQPGMAKVLPKPGNH